MGAQYRRSLSGDAYEEPHGYGWRRSVGSTEIGRAWALPVWRLNVHFRVPEDSAVWKADQALGFVDPASPFRLMRWICLRRSRQKEQQSLSSMASRRGHSFAACLGFFWASVEGFHRHRVLDETHQYMKRLMRERNVLDLGMEVIGICAKMGVCWIG